MKQIFLLAASIFSLNAFSQNATIKGKFDQPNLKRKLSLSRPMNFTQFPEINEMEEITINKGTFIIALTMQQPEILYLISYVNDSIEFNQALFLKKGYALTIACKTKNEKPQLTVAGKGAPDNQPWEGWSNSINFGDYPKDTLPDRIVADLKKMSDKNQEVLQHYIATHKPSANFIKSWNVEMQYQTVRTYYVYAKQRIYSVGKAYYRNIKSWDDIFNQMLVTALLMNETALSSSGYRIFLKMFLLFNKPTVIASEAEKKDFVKSWYANGKDTGIKSFLNDNLNIPTQKTIEKYFTGKVKEYLYAALFKTALERGIVTNIDSVYADFSKQYPLSIYKTLYDDQVAAVTQGLQHTINNKIIFEPAGIKTWAEILNLFKGKTVLLDMWGTWCGPCREEIKANSAALKDYFKDKGLEYLYVANYDEKNQKVWKSLITYFNIEGHHILANMDLTRSIVNQIQPEGGIFFYPAYVLIHKDGSFELSKTGFPMDRKILIGQIEGALK